MKLSVIIPSYNSWPLIGKTLDSLGKQDVSTPFEIVVADCSSDGLDLKIRESYPEVIFLHKDTRDYPGAARNRAIDNSSGEIIAMIDADAEASPDWISRIIENFNREPSALGFGGAIENANRDSKAARVAHFLEFGGFTPRWPARLTRMTPTCNLALRREVFLKARFIEDWFGNEDVLIASEIAKMGGKIYYDPRMLVYHHTRDSWKKIYEHQKRLGTDTGRARYRYNLPGSWLAHTSGASYMIPLIKYILLIKRLTGPDSIYCSDFLSSTPQVVHALNEFASGFRTGVSVEKSQKKK